MTSTPMERQRRKPLVTHGDGRPVTIDDFIRAPWCYDFPLRFQVTRARCAPAIDGAAPLYLWAVLPLHRPGIDRLPVYMDRNYGNRVVELPPCAVLAETWADAMRYATTGQPPRDITKLPKFHAWCWGVTI